MADVRAMLKRVAALERERAPQRSPFVVKHGSFDAFAAQVQSQIDTGALDRIDMPIVLACLRRWESDQTWDGARQRTHGNGVYRR